jgi:hypothetical protein
MKKLDRTGKVPEGIIAILTVVLLLIVGMMGLGKG